MELVSLAPDLWHAESMFGSMFPTRMIVRRTDAGLILWAPVAIDDEMQASLSALGTVHAIVAPNLFHYAHVAGAKERFPEAQVFAPEGLRTRRPNVPIDALLEPGLQLGSGCAVHAVEGSAVMSEFVLHDPETKTLVVTDLVFNVRRAHNFRSWFVFRVVAGTLGDVGQSRLWKTFVKDKEAAGASMRALCELPFERLMMGHGEVVEEGGADALAKATSHWT